MKRPLVLFVLFVLLFAIPVHAAPKVVRVLTYLPREVGHSYVNMFTFKHPVLALEQWASVGALVFDEKTTMDAFARCSHCAEAGFFNHGRRYGIGQTAANVALAGTLYVTAEQYTTDAERDNGRVWRNIPNILFVAPVTFHVMAGVSNMAVRGDAPRPIIPVPVE